MIPEYDDGTVSVYHCEHAALAAHLRETGVTADAMIVDAPYSERTHSGHDASVGRTGEAAGYDNAYRNTVPYAAWSPGDVREFVLLWRDGVHGWIVSLTDHILAIEWGAALSAANRLAFSPLACVAPGSRVRMLGDGPSQWSTFAVVARPRSAAWAKWGALPGAYVLPPGANDLHSTSARASYITGGKPVWLIRALVRDYSRPGDTIVDPVCGAGTLGVAVRYEGRRAILADRAPLAVETTIKRLRGERTKPTRDDFPETQEQPSLFTKPGSGQ